MQIEHIELAKLELRSGDVLVVRAPAKYEAHVIDQAVTAALKRAGVTNVPILIGPPDIEFQIMREADGTSTEG
jgi:hypothetical protein